MKIMVINQHFYPEVASSGQIITELCQDLVKEGHQVAVVTGRPSYRPTKEISSLTSSGKDAGGRGSVYDLGRAVRFLVKLFPPWILEWKSLFGVNVLRAYNYAPRLQEGPWRYVQRMAQYLSFFASSLIIAVLLPRPDVILFLSTPPLLNGVTANILKIFKRIPYVMNIQDLYPDVAIGLGVVRNSAIIRFSLFLERYLYNEAALIIPIGVRMAQEVINKGVPPVKINIIPNWTDTDQITPLGKGTPFSSEHHLVNSFVVMYSGNIGLSQGLENVIQAAALTRDLNDLIYILIGGGANLEYLKRMTDDLELENVKFLPYQPKERLSESLSAADVHLLPLKRGLSKYSVPSKVYGIMSAARPFIASVDEDSEIANMLKEAGCGVRVEPEDPVAIADAVRSLYNDDHTKLDRLGMNGRIYLEKHITRSICVGRYLTALSKVSSAYR